MVRPIETPPSLEELADLPILAGLPREVLEWLAGHGEHLAFDPEDRFAEEGAPAREMFILLEGEARIFFREGNHVALWNSLLRGAVTGLLPFSRMTHYAGVLVGMTTGRLIRLSREFFPELLRLSPPLGERLVGLLSDRVRDATRIEQQRDKMMALGRLSAGLAHELNNPAASVSRNAGELLERLARMPELVVAVAGCGAGPEALAAAEKLRRDVAARPQGGHLSPLRRSALEEELGDWMEEQGIGEPWILTEGFVDAGFTLVDLESLAAAVPERALPPLVQWLEGGIASQRILQDIAEAAGRIAHLVSSVKSYSHMDRAPDPEPVDVRMGLDQTLVMLGHAVRERKVEVVREFDEELPPVQGFAGELNQVWTNLIDNALDSMEPGGTLTLRARGVDGRVLVQVEDTGQGIPPEVLPHIFEPFFTTKGMGEGTGLGLDIVQRIIRRQHRGDIRVESAPGRTLFTVVLPLDAEVGAARAPGGDAFFGDPEVVEP